MKSVMPSRSRDSIHIIVGAIFRMTALTAHAAVLSGHVEDQAGHRSIKGAAIELVELHRTETTGADGVFRFADLAPGHYTLRISIPSSGAKPVRTRRVRTFPSSS